MVSGANEFPTNEIVDMATFNEQIASPIRYWLASNPTKHPQYIVMFLDVPTRIHEPAYYTNSVSYQVYCTYGGIPPFITYINMNGSNDCMAYIDKFEHFGTNYSPSALLISASATGYGNTNYVLDDVRHDEYALSTNISRGTNALLNAGVCVYDFHPVGTEIDQCLARDTNFPFFCLSRLRTPPASDQRLECGRVLLVGLP